MRVGEGKRHMSAGVRVSVAVNVRLKVDKIDRHKHSSNRAVAAKTKEEEAGQSAA